MSSDSEDDFYGNITERLQKEKDKFVEDKTETASLFDDTIELDEIVKNCKLPPKNKRNTVKKSTEDSAGSSVSDLPNVSVDKSGKRAPKRVTRSSARTNNVDVSADLELPPTRSKRRKTANTSTASEGGEESQDSTPRGRGRGRGGSRGRGRGATRGRGRGARGRGRRGRLWMDTEGDMLSQIIAMISSPRQRNTWDPSIPTFSVGNTYEYPDKSHEQALFSNSNKKTDDVVVLEEEENNDDENEELSVKVYWQSSEFFKFTIRKFQKLTQIFDYFAKKENVTHDKLLLTYNERILRPDDTPDSIEYNIAKFIDGGIVTQQFVDIISKENDKIKGGIKIKFQCQNMKKPFEITVRPDDKLSVAMMQCSEHLEKPLDKLRFEFDGDSISGKSTPRELEFEGGECIDVRILS